jgi:hypothetical protein
MIEWANNMSFQPHNFIIRAKQDDYMGPSNDENRMRYYCIRTYPNDYKDENQMLLRRLQIYAKKSE